MVEWKIKTTTKTCYTFTLVIKPFKVEIHRAFLDIPDNKYLIQNALLMLLVFLVVEDGSKKLILKACFFLVYAINIRK